MQDVECGLWRYYGICEGLSHIVNLQCQVLQRGILRKIIIFVEYLWNERTGIKDIYGGESVFECDWYIK